MELSKHKPSQKLEKTIDSWVKNHHIYTLKTQDKRRISSEKNCLDFILKIYGKTENDKTFVKAKAKIIFKKIKNKYKAKLARVARNQTLQKIQVRYPNIDIMRAYKYGVLKNKIALTPNDLKYFEETLNILSKQAIKSKK